MLSQFGWKSGNFWVDLSDAAVLGMDRRAVNISMKDGYHCLTF